VGIEEFLKFHMYIPRGVIDKECAASVSLVVSLLAERVEETAFGGGHKVINRHLLSW
jgi:hypothetical protein